MSESPYMALLWTYAPKILLMLVIVAVVGVLVARRVKAPQVRSLAFAGLGLLLLGVLAAPPTYAWLAMQAQAVGVGALAMPYAAAGAILGVALSTLASAVYLGCKYKFGRETISPAAMRSAQWKPSML